jgi:SAM-dependent methyltransferase
MYLAYKGGIFMKDIFSHIYKHNLWEGTESVSGPGSSVNEAQKLIDTLPFLFEQYKIKSILDAPCGDFNWMQHVPKHNISYTGIDIVDELIKINNGKYSNEQIRFKEMNIVKDDLPTVDLIICRDCLVHLSKTHIIQAIRNFKKSGSKYLLTSHYPYITANTEINTGGWRPINLCLSPFFYPAPIFVIIETDPYKAMALWELSSINV